MADPLTTVREAWGDDAPDWILRLAEECAAASQRKVAERMGRSATLVNQVLQGKYRGDLNGVEAVVRGIWMSGTVDCPALGEIPSNDCQDWRRKAQRFGSANALRVRMYRACNGCPRNRRGDG